MIDMAGKDILPAVIRYTKQLADTVIAVEAAGGDAQVQRELLARVSVMLRQANGALTDLREKQAQAASLSGEAQARAYYEQVTTAMQLLRAPVDHLEMVVDGALWPVPTYGELLFNVCVARKWHEKTPAARAALGGAGAVLSADGGRDGALGHEQRGFGHVQRDGARADPQ